MGDNLVKHTWIGCHVRPAARENNWAPSDRCVMKYQTTALIAYPGTAVRRLYRQGAVFATR